MSFGTSPYDHRPGEFVQLTGSGPIDQEMGVPPSVRKDFIDLTKVGSRGDHHVPPSVRREFIDMTKVGPMGDHLVPPWVRKDFIDLTTAGPMRDLRAPSAGARPGAIPEACGYRNACSENEPLMQMPSAAAGVFDMRTGSLIVVPGVLLDAGQVIPQGIPPKCSASAIKQFWVIPGVTKAADESAAGRAFGDVNALVNWKKQQHENWQLKRTPGFWAMQVVQPQATPPAECEYAQFILFSAFWQMVPDPDNVGSGVIQDLPLRNADDELIYSSNLLDEGPKKDWGWYPVTRPTFDQMSFNVAANALSWEAYVVFVLVIRDKETKQWLYLKYWYLWLQMIHGQAQAGAAPVAWDIWSDADSMYGLGGLGDGDTPAGQEDASGRRNEPSSDSPSRPYGGNSPASPKKTTWIKSLNSGPPRTG